MARFFIDRPVFAIVISLVIMIAGGLSIIGLPVAQFPQISPPTVEVEITYPGANAETVEQTIATAVEQEVNGAENMIYMTSKSAADGRYVLTCTFNVGTNLDLANVDINNRVNKAVAKLPPEAVAAGISVKKKSPDMLMVVSIYSPDNSYDDVFLSNYASIQLVDAIARTPGVGSTMIVGQRDYAMRLWVRPDKLMKLDLTAGDLAKAIREQNVVVPAGAVGQPPAKPGTEFQYAVNVKGRLNTPAEFENIIIRTLPDGSILRVRDVARTELGAKTYTSYGRMNAKPATLIVVYQLPGANAIQTAEHLRALLKETSRTFPPGLAYEISLDTTEFVKVAIHEVFLTLRDAIILVLLVVFIFLGSFRATLIPMLAVPVSLIGTFAAFPALGFSINTLTMFGIVLAVGIVVDDAIVVVEAVEHHIGHGLSPLDATIKAMEDVSGPVVAVALVLCAVFVPVAFMGGITGQLYKQFAVTISVSVLISALVALTLTPALCAMLLKPRREMRGPLGTFLRGFNRVLNWGTEGYVGLVRIIIRRVILTMLALAVVIVGVGGLTRLLPKSFVTDEDLGYFFVVANLPDGASLERTDALTKRLETSLTDQKRFPGIQSVVTMGGLNIVNNTYTSNNATVICIMRPWGERKTEEESLTATVAKVRQEVNQYPEALSFAVTPPPIPGLGTTGGLQFQLEDRSGRPLGELADVSKEFMFSAMQVPPLASAFTLFRTTVPQIKLDLDRDKIRVQGIPIDDVFQSLQIYLGGLQVNDFNLFNRTYKVMLQAEPEFRATPESIEQIYVRTHAGTMASLNTLAKIGATTGADVIVRHNMYRTAEFTCVPKTGYSSGQGMAAVGALAKANLPPGYAYEWTGTAYQEQQAGGAQTLILVLALTFVFLFLAAQYESWSLPLSVLLGLPIAIAGALLGIALRGYSNDVYVQIGIVTLLGLAAKNAILIVEFAKLKHEAGSTLLDAAVEGSRLRLRPILMTAFAFVLGVLPLVIASGAGSVSRRSLGTAVFSGMLIASTIGIFFIPVLYVVTQGVSEKLFGRPERPPP